MRSAPSSSSGTSSSRRSQTSGTRWRSRRRPRPPRAQPPPATAQPPSSCPPARGPTYRCPSPVKGQSSHPSLRRAADGPLECLRAPRMSLKLKLRARVTPFARAREERTVSDYAGSISRRGVECKCMISRFAPSPGGFGGLFAGVFEVMSFPALTELRSMRLRL